ncbi:MAG: hypothetical protein ABSD89_04405 [Halobacteriota archaeon]
MKRLFLIPAPRSVHLVNNDGAIDIARAQMKIEHVRPSGPGRSLSADRGYGCVLCGGKERPSSPPFFDASSGRKRVADIFIGNFTFIIKSPYL